MSKLKLDYAGSQDVGRRESQQDAFLIREIAPHSHIVGLLADGMGGHVAGEVAANLAIDTFEKQMAEEDSPVNVTFDRLLDRANRALANEVSENPDHEGMGCTFVALEIVEQSYCWISIGDSPLYLLRDGQLHRENADHSMASRLDAAARAGDITWEEAKQSPSRNALLYALTGEPLSRIDYQRQPKPLREGDWLILASDGLDSLENDEIVASTRQNAPSGAQGVVDALLRSVREKGDPKQDNTTLIAIGVSEQVGRPATDNVVTRPFRR